MIQKFYELKAYMLMKKIAGIDNAGSVQLEENLTNDAT